MHATESLSAIDVHDHYGTYIRRGDKNDTFCSADAAEIVRRASAVGIGLTIVSPLSSLLPRCQADAVSGNNEAARVVAEIPELRQYVAIDPRREETCAPAEELLTQPQCVGIKIHPEEHGYTIHEFARPIFEFAARHSAVMLTHSSEKNSLAADFVP